MSLRAGSKLHPQELGLGHPQVRELGLTICFVEPPSAAACPCFRQCFGPHADPAAPASVRQPLVDRAPGRWSCPRQLFDLLLPARRRRAMHRLGRVVAEGARVAVLLHQTVEHVQGGRRPRPPRPGPAPAGRCSGSARMPIPAASTSRVRTCSATSVKAAVQLGQVQQQVRDRLQTLAGRALGLVQRGVVRVRPRRHA